MSSGLRRECSQDSAAVPAGHLLDLPGNRLDFPCCAEIPGCLAARRGGSRRFARHSYLDRTVAREASRTLNPRPEKVTDPAFGPGRFFDPADLVQVKYEMVRRAEAADVPASRAAAGFGFSRQSLYSARAALRERGLAGPVPAKPGPKGGHKLTGQVVDLLEDLLEADPGLRPADLAAAVRERFGVSVHPRSVERALQRRRTARREDEQSGGQAPRAAPES